MINKINAIVTGGSSGLGEATARKILEKGGNVSILDTQEGEAKGLSEEFGEACTFFYTDVTNEESINEALTSAISKYQFINELIIINKIKINLQRQCPLNLKLHNL